MIYGSSGSWSVPQHVWVRRGERWMMCAGTWKADSKRPMRRVMVSGWGSLGGGISEDVGLEWVTGRTWGEGRRERLVMGMRMPLFVFWAVRTRRDGRVREGKRH